MSDDGTLFGNMYPPFLIDFIDFVIGFVMRMGRIRVGRWSGKIYALGCGFILFPGEGTLLN